MPDPSGSAAGPGLQQLGDTSIRLGRAVLTTLYAALALFGLLVTAPLLVLVLGPLLAATAAGLFALDVHDRRGYWPVRRHVGHAAAVGAGLPAFCQGADVLDGLGAALVTTVLVLAVVVGLHARAGTGSVPALTSVTTAGDASADDTELRALLRSAPLPMLFRRWRSTSRDVRGRTGGVQYASAVYLRDLLVDELLHRDPVGTRRWLDLGGASPPERYIRNDGHRAA